MFKKQLLKMTDFLNRNKSTLLLILRYLVLILIGVLILRLMFNNQLKYNDYQLILTTILSTTGITVAIIVSFLFAKLFSEKDERIARKRLIDKESHKITAFRKICHFLKGSHEFWKPFGNLKTKLDNKYSKLTLASYDSSEIDYERYSAFLKEVNFGEIGGQAYVGLREIEGNEASGIVYYDSQLRKNYSLDEIRQIHDASNRVWSFFDKQKLKMIQVSNISDLELKHIKKNIEYIYPDYEIDKLNNEKLSEMFDEFHEAISRKLFSLTQKNNGLFGKRFNLLLGNLVLFVLIVIAGVFLLSLNYLECQKIFDIQVLISVFLIGVIDLLINVIQAIRKELKVDEFYEL